MSQTDILKIDNLTVRFGNKTIINGFSISLKHGEKTVLMGPSGSGKTTVLRCILGFIIPENGSIFIEGTPLNTESVWKLRARMAYVAQEPDIGEGLVREIIERPFEYHVNAHLNANLKQVSKLLERFNLLRISFVWPIKSSLPNCNNVWLIFN